MKERTAVKDMGEKEFIEKYASKKAIDDAEKRMQEKLRKEKIADLDGSLKRAEDYLKKGDPTLYSAALAELGHIKAEIDFYHSKGARLTKEDFNHYDSKFKSEINNLIKTAEYKLSKANAPEQKIYKEAIGAAKEYLKKRTEPVKPVLEKFEKVFSEDRFQKNMQDLRKQFGSEKSYEAVSAYKNLALSTKDPEYQIECLKEAKEKYAPNKDIENVLQRDIDHLTSNTKKYKELHKSKD
jgi:ElaB/YqjD/DUF883 family membrane-anchored ribosome-binding protein